MYYRHDLDYRYPEQCDAHMIDVKHLRDVELDENYPYLQKSVLNIGDPIFHEKSLSVPEAVRKNVARCVSHHAGDERHPSRRSHLQHRSEWGNLSENHVKAANSIVNSKTQKLLLLRFDLRQLFGEKS